MEKCVFSTLLISLGSVYTLLSVSSLVTLVILDPIPIWLFIPLHVLLTFLELSLKKGVVVVRFSIVNFIIHLISYLSIRGPVEVSLVYLFEALSFSILMSSIGKRALSLSLVVPDDQQCLRIFVATIPKQCKGLPLIKLYANESLVNHFEYSQE